MRQASTSPDSVADWASSKDQRGGQADMSYSDDSDDDAGYKKYEPSWADSGRKSSFKRREDDIGKAPTPVHVPCQINECVLLCELFVQSGTGNLGAG